MTSAKIVLIGMPGAGKSTFGKRLAEALNYGFVDLDDTIEELSGTTIPMLFQISEEHFRARETAALKAVVAERRSLIIASGGGTPCFNDNMVYILKNCFSIFLDPPMSVLVSRTEKESHRPLLQGEDTATRLQELYDLRRSYYEQADVRLTAVTPDPTKVINLIGSD